MKSLKFIVPAILILLLIIVTCLWTGYCDYSKLGLSKDEIAWLKDNKDNLSFTYDPMYPPVELVNEDGAYDGIAKDYIDLVEKKLKFDFKDVKSDTWVQALGSVKNKKVNFLAAAHKTGPRSVYLDFTTPYVEVPIVIVVPKINRRTYKIADLKGMRVAVAQSHAVADMLRKVAPDLEFKELESNLHGLMSVERGELDAFIIDSVAASFIIQKNNIKNLRVSAKTELSYKLSIALHKGQRRLLDIFNKTLKKISKDELSKIEKKWNYYNLIDNNKKHSFLNNEEYAWLEKNKNNIVLAPDSKYEPIEFFDDGRFSGIAVEYVKRLEEILGVGFKYKYYDNWQDNLKAAKNHEFDLWSAVAPSAVKKTYMSFTKPYLKLKTVLLVSDEQLRNLRLDTVRNESVLVVEGYYTDDYIKRYYPNVNVITVSNVTEALRRVSFKENDAFVCDIVTALYLMEQEGLTNLKIASEVDVDYELAFAVRKDWPIFRDILDKALERISLEERNEIHAKWVSVDSNLLDYSRWFKKVIFVLALVLFLSILAFTSNIMLRKILRQQKKKLIESETDLAIFKLMNDTAVHGILYADYEGQIIYLNKAFANMHGRTVGELVGKHVSVFHSVKQMPALNRLINEIKEKGSLSNVELWHARADGSEFPTLMNFKIFELENKTYVSAVAVDISNEKRTQQLMMQNEKMMSLGGLAAGMAHEINNPLGAVLQTLQNIHRRLEPNVVKNMKVAKECGLDLDAMANYLNKRSIFKFIDGARESGERAAKLIENMLNFAGNKSAIKQREDIAVLMDKAIDLAMHDYDLKSKYDFKRIKLEKDYCFGQCYSEVIGIEIEQVFFNMLKNSAHAFSTETDLDNVNTISLSIKPVTDYIRIEIEDNGPGIPEEECHKVFEPFYTSKAPGVGTGLGLSIAYFIITENHKGKLDLESEQGKGTKFIIELKSKG